MSDPTGAPSPNGTTASCTYDLDAELRITAVDEGWIHFAVNNNGRRLLPPSCLGRSVLRAISDATTAHLYRILFENVRRQRQPVSIHIRCDSPTMRRWLELRIEPRGRAFRVRSTVLREETRQLPVLLSVRPQAQGPLLRMCGWCNRVHAGDGWREVEEAASRLGLFELPAYAGITHGICPDCHAKLLELVGNLEAPLMQCPKCRGAMTAVSYNGVEVDRCDSCGGLWFDALEDRALLAQQGSEAIDTGDPHTGASHDTQGKIDCPRCRSRMVRLVDRQQPHIWYEQCSVCHGSFFDAGEFRDLKEHSIADFFRHRRKGPRPLQ